MRRVSSEAGQSLPLLLAATFVILLAAGVLAAFGGAVSGAEGAQRGADLAALSAVRSMRDDLPRLLAPAVLPSGEPNPRHLSREGYLDRAAGAARQAAARNGLDPARVQVSFPDSTSPTPLRARIAIRASLHGRDVVLAAHAEAEATLAAGYDPTPSYASGGGYSGPLVYRQGEGMRPDVAAAFDRMAAAAAHDGIRLIVNSAYRSDAEQARLYEQNPDPRMVAPPGTSLHRCATELDLGPPSAYGWLEANAPGFGFLQRYPWERWHWGYIRGPAPCSEAGNSLGTGGSSADGPAAGSGLPGFVPQQFRAPILRAAGRWQVPAALLAAQLEAESGFDPMAVSPAGAEGIAQFMPGTAASYGLRNPFDPVAAIDAEAHMMSDLLREFDSVSLALAAYNAGSAPVAACHCVPAIPETQAYVARILALMGAAGEIPAPELEVRLVD